MIFGGVGVSWVPLHRPHDALQVVVVLCQVLSPLAKCQVNEVP